MTTMPSCGRWPQILFPTKENYEGTHTILLYHHTRTRILINLGSYPAMRGEQGPPHCNAAINIEDQVCPLASRDLLLGIKQETSFQKLGRKGSEAKGPLPKRSQERVWL